MVSRPSDLDPNAAPPASKVPIPVKVVIAGGFGVGKTTMVGSISEIEPLTTEAAMTDASREVDRLDPTTGKESTTVAMDFGRITLGNDDLVLYLFGTPGQARFHFMWDELVKGAIGAVVLVDTNHLDDSFSAIDYFEFKGVPFVIAVNCFYGVRQYSPDELRSALAINSRVPILFTDARERAGTRDTLLSLVQHALSVIAE